MAQYKHPRFLTQTNHASFDIVHAGGATAPTSGIYRCEPCGREAVFLSGFPLPANGHHEHAAGLRDISWRLIVGAVVVRDVQPRASPPDSVIL